MADLLQPPIGFIVEGKGEYHSYPSIITRILCKSGFKIPIALAGGVGNIIKHLDEHLTDIIVADHPLSIIITVDLIDNIKKGTVGDCKELCDLLYGNVQSFIDTHQSKERFQPFPEKFCVVIQVQKFETWFIADKFGLKSENLINLETNELDWQNVDDEVANPIAWLSTKAINTINLKDPEMCKSLSTLIDLDIVKTKSKSFDKFQREVIKHYSLWERQFCN